MKLVYAIISVSSAGLLGSCKEHQVTTKQEAEVSIGFEKAHSIILKEKGWVTTFVSRQGKLEGMDSDSKISFYDSGKVRMIEYGYAPVEYSGSYTVDSKGVISAKFDKYPGQWAEMMLRTIEGKVLLFRSDDATGLEFGGRGGAVETPNMKPFWPFGMTELSWKQPETEVEKSEPDIFPGGILPLDPEAILPGMETKQSN